MRSLTCLIGLAAASFAQLGSAAAFSYDLEGFEFTLPMSVIGIPAGIYEVGGTVKTDGTLTDASTPTLSIDHIVYVGISVTDKLTNEEVLYQDYDVTDADEDTLVTQSGAKIVATEKELTLVFDPTDGIVGEFSATDRGLTIGFSEGSVNGFVAHSAAPFQVKVPLTAENSFGLASTGPIPLPPALPLLGCGIVLLLFMCRRGL
ncbi:MAG: hypothetical protein AAGF94_13030 [Pseudomonadota bacterium]